MDKVTILPYDRIYQNFIDPKYLHDGHDEYYYRDQQVKKPEGGWRHLRSDEIERLVLNNNSASNWDDIWVTDQFDTAMVRNNHFFGMVRIGRVTRHVLQYHDLRVPVGITDSSIISCDIGDDVAVHDVHYMANCIIGDRCILFNIQEISTTDHSKFGNGTIKEGEPEDVRVWLEVMNEIGSRKIMPFDGMTTADAYLWAKYVDDTKLQERLKEITQASVDIHRGYYGTIGEGCVIKNCWILKDAKVGPHCYIKGASKLKNVTINSSEEEPSQIGEGVILVNGVTGYGCRIFYSVVATRFVLGDNCNLKYGARLIHSVLGDNSTISCCEVLNNIIFPSHEQHHNNSFLISACVMGQSNMAAGATIGSNHNSRATDGEIVASRGFWPGLCSSVKHSSRFASFTLLSKADYPNELDIRLPFCLVSNNAAKDELHLMPAYWWMYNMYALARNTSKYQSRDKRKRKIQNIEFETLAPDTVEEIIEGRKLLEVWVAKAYLRSQGEDPDRYEYYNLRECGKNLLDNEPYTVEKLEVLGEKVEKGRRKVVIDKALKAYHAYGDMIVYYAVKTCLNYLESHPGVHARQTPPQVDQPRRPDHARGVRRPAPRRHPRRRAQHLGRHPPPLRRALERLPAREAAPRLLLPDVPLQRRHRRDDQGDVAGEPRPGPPHPAVHLRPGLRKPQERLRQRDPQRHLPQRSRKARRRRPHRRRLLRQTNPPTNRRFPNPSPKVQRMNTYFIP